MLRRQEKIPWCLGNPICIWELGDAVVLLSPEQMTKPQNKGLCSRERPSALGAWRVAGSHQLSLCGFRLRTGRPRGSGEGQPVLGAWLALPLIPPTRPVQGGRAGCGSPGRSWGWHSSDTFQLAGGFYLRNSTAVSDH